ncbi:hypothetical protein TALLGRASSMM_93 [Mycobacterium phage TallGrassMM]|nr:hypothetical protein TALLGRASSMM_93 [Mycobacterium phage TallGrassMM]
MSRSSVRAPRCGASSTLCCATRNVMTRSASCSGGFPSPPRRSLGERCVDVSAGQLCVLGTTRR